MSEKPDPEAPPGASVPVTGAGSADVRHGDLAAVGIVQRAADHPAITLSSGARWSRLTAAEEKAAEFLEVVYAPRAPATQEHTRHQGREYGMVIAGRLDVEVNGVVTVLQPGDSIVFDATLPHRFWNAGDVPVRAVWFVRDRDTAGSVPHG